jgi:hypothetical protein
MASRELAGRPLGGRRLAGRGLDGGGGGIRAPLGNASGPPTLSSATITAFTDATADISVTTNKSGGTLYWVIDTSATPPSKAQVKAGQGSGGGAAASSGSQAVAAVGAQTKTGATGLSENTTYYAYFMHETTVGQSNVAASAAFTTYFTASQNIFNAFTTPPVTARKTIINSTVSGLKSDGIWSLLDTLYVMAAADSQAASINWVAPASFTLIAVNSPAFTADSGFTGNGTSSRLRTQYTPSVNGVNYVQDSASAWVWSLTNAASSVNDIGSGTAPRALIITRNASDQLVGDINNAVCAAQSAANTNSIGFFGIQRRASNDRRLWANGVQQGTSAQVSTGVASQEQWVCGANSTSFSAKKQAVAAWGASLSGLESAFYNRLLTYMQAVGAV